MSTDLQLRRELLEIRCPAMTIKINLSVVPSDIADHATNGVILSQEATPTTTAGGAVNGGFEHECRTPKSPRHMIPVNLSCPPAPRKPKRPPTCKRKLCDFFEIVAREEVESFFRQFEEKPKISTSKRRCLV